MVINVEAIINSLGKTYQEIFDEGLIPYRSKPNGPPGVLNIGIDMVKEGIFLSFERSSKILNEITLRLLRDDKVSFVFPNELPSPLMHSMDRVWVRENLGNSIKSIPPRQILRRQFGWKDLYRFKDEISMQISYDMMERVKSVTFLPTSEVRW
ncbi:pyocin immunity protein [Photorhabdus luminescens]|nr:pyocin immunity protein [Photorhabdus luminescens]